METFTPGLPYHVIFGVTNRCNARCVHCYSKSGTGEKDALDTSDICEMIDQFAAAGVFDLGITGGEPLLRKDIASIVAHAVKQNLTVGISTNGYYASPKILRQLQEAGLDRLQVSIDGTEKTHDKLRGIPGLYQKAAGALENCGKIGLRRALCFTAHKKNIKELPELLNRAEAMGVETFNVSLFVPTGRGGWNLLLSPHEMEKLYRLVDEKQGQTQTMEITMHTAKRVLNTPALEETESFIGCQAGVGTSYVNSFGDLTPCVLLPVKVGNLKEDNFEDAWKSSPVIAELQERRVEGFCSECDKLRKCGGCRAIAYQKYKDSHLPKPWLASDTTCWVEQA